MTKTYSYLGGECKYYISIQIFRTLREKSMKFSLLNYSIQALKKVNLERKREKANGHTEGFVLSLHLVPKNGSL